MDTPNMTDIINRLSAELASMTVRALVAESQLAALLNPADSAEEPEA